MIDVEGIFMDSGAWGLYRQHVLKRGKSGERIGKHGRVLEPPPILNSSLDFSYFNLVKGSPFRTYCDAYAKFMKAMDNRLDFCANVDVIGNPDLTIETQRYFEEEHGLRPVPVIHQGASMKYVEHYLGRNYDMIGLGGFASGVGGWETMRPWCDDVFMIVCPASNKHLPVCKVHGFAMTGLKGIWRWPWYCMTDEHEVLTRRGWKKRSELFIGEHILAFDEGRSRWQRVTSIPEYQVEDQTLVSLQNRNCYAEITLNHRWVVENRNGEYVWRTTGELMATPSAFKIPRSGKLRGFPEQSPYSDDMIALLGWFWTDGCRRCSKGRTPSIGIYQSESANPEKTREIRSLLDRIGPWNETPSHPEGMVHFEVRGPAVTEILELCSPNKDIPIEFVSRLTEKQLRLFVETSLKGDGYEGRLKGGPSFEIGQKGGRNIEVMQVASMLLGFATSTYQSAGDTQFLRSSTVDSVYTYQLKKTLFNYSGKIWCVTVPSGAFFTRCRGHIYVTGNSVDSTSWLIWPANGWIPVPRWSEGKGWMYDRQPMVINACPASSTLKRRERHLFNVSDRVRGLLLRYMEEAEVPIGSVNDKGKLKEWGIVSHHRARMQANLYYFKELQNHMPPWPWALNPEIIGRRRAIPAGFGL